MQDLWSSGDAYEAYMGRWSRAVAVRFVPWLAVAAGSSWLDVGCGTGALTQTILAVGEPSHVTGVDPSTAFVAKASETTTDNRATFQVGSGQDLPDGLQDFDAVVSGLVLNFVPDVDAMLGRMLMALRPGGTAGAYVWDYSEQMELIRHFWEAATELDPAARGLDEGRQASICRPDVLMELFSKRFTSVEVTDITVPTTFNTFDDYWAPFEGGIGPAPAYAVSLSQERKELLREKLRERIPSGPDGSLRLKARAWAVKGRRT